MLTRRRLLAGAAGIAGASVAGAAARAQHYPDRLIKIIVPGTAGGPTDTMARLVAQRLQVALGQSVIIDNRAGGGGSAAAKAVANAEPDGYTLLFCNTSIMTTIPAVVRRQEYNAEKDFAPVAKVSQSEQLLVLHPSVPANSVKEFVAYCKANPGKINCAATGYGGLPHMAAEYFKSAAGVDFTIIQYKGGGESMNAVLGHQVDITFETTTVILPHMRSGTLKGLAVTSEARNPLVPELPTMVEAGVPGYVGLSFNGVVVPAATPPAVIDTLNGAINDILRTPAMQADVERLGGFINVGSPQDFATFIAREAKRWRDVADAANIKVD
jgi:tripartite-type tricarboxylate transporter receptor subunit TctC